MAVLLTKIIETPPSSSPQVLVLEVERVDLYRRRFRLTTEAGQDIAVDLEQPPKHGEILSDASSENLYQIKQLAEEVVSIPVPEDATMAAKIGWYLGNRHIPIEVRLSEILFENFPTITDALDRIGIDYEVRQDILSCAPHSADHRH